MSLIVRGQRPTDRLVFDASEEVFLKFTSAINSVKCNRVDNDNERVTIRCNQRGFNGLGNYHRVTGGREKMLQRKEPPKVSQGACWSTNSVF